jgi:hypothetical protein
MGDYENGRQKSHPIPVICARASLKAGFLAGRSTTNREIVRKRVIKEQHAGRPN